MEIEAPQMHGVAADGRASTLISGTGIAELQTHGVSIDGQTPALKSGFDSKISLRSTRSFWLEAPDTPSLLSKEQALFNFVAGVVGAGLLVLPKTVSKVGWVPGLGLICMVTVVSAASCHLVHRSMTMNSGVRCAQDLAMKAFGPIMHKVVLVFNNCDLFAGCVILLVGGGDLASIIFGSEKQIQCIVGVCCVVGLLSLPKDLSGLSKAALFGVVTLVMFLVVYLSDGFLAIVGPDRSTDQLLANLETSALSGAAAIIGLSYCGPILIPSMHAEMADIHELPWVINVGHAIVFTVYASMPVVGYAGYGREGLDVVPEISSLKKLPWAPIFCACCAMVTMLVGYPLFMNPIVVQIEELFKSSPDRELRTRLCVRLTMVSLTLLVALIIPYFYEIIVLTGSITTNMMCMIFPVAYYLKSIANARAAGKSDSAPSLIMTSLIALAVVQGLLVMTVGVYYGALDLGDAIERGQEL